MNQGKSTCKVLKEVRRKIADANGISLEERECTHMGDCAGTCPYCEAEVRYLERELSKHKSLGKAVAVAGIAMAAVMPAVAQTPETSNPTVTSRNASSHKDASQQLPSKTCSTYQMPGIVPESDTSSTSSSNSDIVPPDTLDEPPIMGLAVRFIDSDLYWQFPSNQGTLKSYLRKQLKKDPELRRWLRKKITEQLRDESREDIFTVEFNTLGEVFGLHMNFDISKYEDRREFEKLYQIFMEMPPWEPYYNVEQHKYYVRQRIPVQVLR